MSDSPHSPVPRFGTPRRLARPTRGPVLASVGELLGWPFFPWQSYASDVAMEYDPATGLPSYRTVGIGAGRQNGKTVFVCARIAAQLIVPRSTVAFTAQDRNIARLKWEEHCTLLMETPFAERVRRVSRINGGECLYMKNGSRYLIVTPGPSAGRSLSLDLGVIDEAYAQESMALVGAMGGTMAARPNAQMWILSNAGTSKSVLWRHYTDLGRAEINNPLSSFCWLEWCADENADVLDRQAWLDANPSLGLPHGVMDTALSDAALTYDHDTFAREHLNLWVDAMALIGIDAVTWAACRDDDAVPTNNIALSLDVTPERDRGTLVVVGENAGNAGNAGTVQSVQSVQQPGTTGTTGTRTPIEVLVATSDLELLVARTIEVAISHNATVVLDRGSPAASVIPALEHANVEVRQISLNDFAKACGDFHDAAVHHRLSHRGDYRLSDAVAGASKRRVGDGWCWRRRGGADITPLVAATLARWGVVSAAELPQVQVW